MISNFNKKILIIIIIILVVIVVLGIIGYLVYSKKIETFKSLNNYVPTNQGDPLSNNLQDDIITNAQNPIYNMDNNHQIINLISNISGTSIFASCIDSANGNNLAFCSYNNTDNKWFCLQFDIGSNNNLVAFNKLNPTATLPEMNNNISCSKDSSILIASNSHTLFINNTPYNLLRRLNCLYYSSVSEESDTINLNCLALPKLNIPSTVAQSSNNRPPLSYDKMNFICANDRILLGLSCSNKFYYVLLDNTTGAPNSNSSWSGIDIMLPNIPNLNFKNIIYLGMNDYSVFMYYNDYNNNATLIYSPLNISNRVLTLTLELLPIKQNLQGNSSTDSLPLQISSLNNLVIKPNFYSNGFAINNDVIFGLERPDNSGNMNLWWCSLNNGLPANTSSWKNMNLGNQRVANLPFYNLTAIYIFNNNLIINYRTGSKNNFVIPLLSNSSNPTNSVSILPSTTSNNTNGITTSTNPFQIPNNSSENDISTTSTMTSDANGTTIPNITSILESNNSDITTTSNTLPNTMPDTEQYTTTTTPNTNPLNTNNNNLTPMNDMGSSGSLLNGLSASAQNGIRTNVGVNGVNGNLGNKDNINDFMKDANVLGNNIYVSPMNNDQLYNPQAKLSQLGKITSSFFPMIKIAQ
jgi:hypothetical protein